MSILAKKLMFVMSQRRRREIISIPLMEILGQRTVGPDMGQYDPVTDTGYYGLVPSTELIAGDVLATQIGLTAGVPQYNDAGWFKFYVGPEATCNRNNNGYAYVAYVARMPNRYNLSWDHINGVNAVYGYRHEPVLGMNSQVRLITGAEADPTAFSAGTSCLDDPGINSEWNELFYRIHEVVPDCSDVTLGMDGGDSTTRHGGPQSAGFNWAEYTNAQTGVLETLNLGSFCWAQESSGSNRVGRGRRGLAFWVAGVSTSTTNYGWRPVLQPTSPTVLLLHGDGADGSDITDSSVYGHPVTVNGNARISTDQSVYPGGSSMYFDGSGSYVGTPPSDFFDFGTKDFTIEYYVRRISKVGLHGRVIGNMAAYGGTVVACGIDLNTVSAGHSFSASNISTPITKINDPIINGVWYHVAHCRKDGIFYLYVDGVLKDTNGAHTTKVVDMSPYTISLGRGGETTTYFNGYLQDVRFTRNKALYTTNFTPPSAPLPDPDPYDFSLFS